MAVQSNYNHREILSGWFETDSSPRWLLDVRMEVLAQNAAATQFIHRKLGLTVLGNILLPSSEENRTDFDQSRISAIRDKNAFFFIKNRFSSKLGALGSMTFHMHEGNRPAFFAFSINELNSNRSLAALKTICHSFGLTQGETRTIFSCIIDSSTKAMAKHAFVSENTVNAHLRKIFAKLEVRSKSEALNVIFRTFLAAI